MFNDSSSLEYESLKHEHDRTLTSLSTLREIVSVLRQELQDSDKLKEEALSCVESLQHELELLRPYKRQHIELTDTVTSLQEELSLTRRSLTQQQHHNQELKSVLQKQKQARRYESQRAETALMYINDSSIERDSIITQLTSEVRKLEQAIEERDRLLVDKHRPNADITRTFSSPLSSPHPSTSYVSLSKENVALKSVVERQSEELGRLKKRSKVDVDVERLEQLLLLKDREILELTNALLSGQD
ncbi:hypothetical protein P9112_000749 [Eukaryota sp. TZLM1-RC]